MNGEMTTAAKGMFRVQDVSLRNPRRQSEVAKEIAAEKGIAPGEVRAPVSLTPESVKSFFSKKAESTTNPDEKKIYTQTIAWINECFDLRKKVVFLESKLPKEVEDKDDGSDIDTEDLN